MTVGDVVRVRLPEGSRIGILVKLPKKMYMVGYVAEVMIDGSVRLVQTTRIEIIESGNN